ncbi:hypothetical protein TIFTF001_004590 [Ficus carica]|uniref:AP2/ERF domain-containing protein n=1 Tax=Ficus carica TaxID=3494 RepID=A0AA87ZDH1_FICCA|nr:hypothetical protein TIFTF001_004590 [Ficus carica]
MKSMNNDENNNNNNSNNNWLGFSLSPNMKMEVPHSSSTSSSTISPPTTTFFHSSPPPPQHHLNYGLYYGENNAGFYSPLSVMPLKSDGSLCIMEALSRSQPPAMVASSTTTPKLEDFFGGAYESNEREVMALSLDSMFYNHQNMLSQNQDQPQQQPQPQQPQNHYSYYSNGASLASCNLQLPTMAMAMAMEQKNNTHSNSSVIGTNCMTENGGESMGMGYGGDLHSLSLSMSPGSQSSSCVTVSHQISPAVTTAHHDHDYVAAMDTKKRGPEKVDQKQIVHRKSLDTFGQRTSQYRGVTRHRWTGRYEAHLWDNSCKKEGQSRKGRQGGYDMEEKAARAYDLAALKYWGPSTHINFPLGNYQKELEEMKNMTRQEYVAHLRRKSSGFSRGASIYRGVTSRYLATFFDIVRLCTQEEAAEAYDIAAIKFRGLNAVTNFDITRYDVDRIMASNTLLAGDLARRAKEAGSPGSEAANHNSAANSIIDEITVSKKDNESESDWKMMLYHSSQQLDQKPLSIDTYKTESFSVAPLSMIHHEVEDSAKMGTHMSNASSLVTSLSSSREGSPDKSSLPALFGMPPSVSKFFTSPTNAVNSWIPSTQQRPAISMPHMPIFAAWTDT